MYILCIYFCICCVALEGGFAVLLSGPLEQGGSIADQPQFNITCMLCKTTVGLGLILVT